MKGRSQDMKERTTERKKLEAEALVLMRSVSVDTGSI